MVEVWSVDLNHSSKVCSCLLDWTVAAELSGVEQSGGLELVVPERGKHTCVDDMVGGTCSAELHVHVACRGGYDCYMGV